MIQRLYDSCGVNHKPEGVQNSERLFAKVCVVGRRLVVIIVGRIELQSELSTIDVSVDGLTRAAIDLAVFQGYSRLSIGEENGCFGVCLGLEVIRETSECGEWGNGDWRVEEGRGKREVEVEVEVQSSEMRNEKLIEVTEESKAKQSKAGED